MSGGVLEPKIVVYNLGAPCTQVKLRFQPEFGRQAFFDLGAMTKEQQKQISLVVDNPSATATTGIINYLDADDVFGQAQFDLELSSELLLLFGPARRVI